MTCVGGDPWHALCLVSHTNRQPSRTPVCQINKGCTSNLHLTPHPCPTCGLEACLVMAQTKRLQPRLQHLVSAAAGRGLAWRLSFGCAGLLRQIIIQAPISERFPIEGIRIRIRLALLGRRLGPDSCRFRGQLTESAPTQRQPVAHGAWDPASPIELVASCLWTLWSARLQMLGVGLRGAGPPI